MSFLKSRVLYSSCQIVNFIIRLIGVNHVIFSDSSWSIYILDFRFRAFVSQFLAISVNYQFQWLRFNLNFPLHLASIISIVTLSRRLDFWLLHRYVLIERCKTSTS